MSLLGSTVPFASATAVPRAASSGEPALVERSRNGDQDAFAALVQLHHRRVWRLCARFFAERSDVEDAAQDTFLRCWEKLHTYREVAPFEHWLTRLCLNTCYSKLRRAKPTEGSSTATSSIDASTAYDPRSPLELVSPECDPSAPVDARRLLARLNPADRFVLVLLESHGWSTAEVAARLGWTRVNVKVRAHRARRRLRALAEGSLG